MRGPSYVRSNRAQAARRRPTWTQAAHCAGRSIRTLPALGAGARGPAPETSPSAKPVTDVAAERGRGTTCKTFGSASAVTDMTNMVEARERPGLYDYEFIDVPVRNKRLNGGRRRTDITSGVNSNASPSRVVQRTLRAEVGSYSVLDARRPPISTSASRK